MPIYEYRCSSCGHELEALQKFSDAPLTACPACSRDSLVKLISAAGFQLKGTGWYATDFKSSSTAKPAAKAEGESKPAEAKAEAKSDTASASPAPASAPATTTGTGSASS
jgi:putative FmdB family regulatory protein